MSLLNTKRKKEHCMCYQVQWVGWTMNRNRHLHWVVIPLLFLNPCLTSSNIKSIWILENISWIFVSKRKENWIAERTISPLHDQGNNLSSNAYQHYNLFYAQRRLQGLESMKFISNILPLQSANYSKVFWTALRKWNCLQHENITNDTAAKVLRGLVQPQIPGCWSDALPNLRQRQRLYLQQKCTVFIRMDRRQQVEQ